MQQVRWWWEKPQLCLDVTSCQMKYVWNQSDGVYISLSMSNANYLFALMIKWVMAQRYFLNLKSINFSRLISKRCVHPMEQAPWADFLKNDKIQKYFLGSVTWNMYRKVRSEVTECQTHAHSAFLRPRRRINRTNSEFWESLSSWQNARRGVVIATTRVTRVETFWNLNFFLAEFILYRTRRSKNVCFDVIVNLYIWLSFLFLSIYWFFVSFLSSGPALLTGDMEGSSRYFAGDGDNDVIHAPRLSINNSRLKYVSKSVQGQTSFMHKPYIYATSVLAIVQTGNSMGW